MLRYVLESRLVFVLLQGLCILWACVSCRSADMLIEKEADGFVVLRDRVALDGQRETHSYIRGVVYDSLSMSFPNVYRVSMVSGDKDTATYVVRLQSGQHAIGQMFSVQVEPGVYTVIVERGRKDGLTIKNVKVREREALIIDVVLIGAVI